MVEALLAWIAYRKLVMKGLWPGESAQHDLDMSNALDRLVEAGDALRQNDLLGWI